MIPKWAVATVFVHCEPGLNVFYEEQTKLKLPHLIFVLTKYDVFFKRNDGSTTDIY